MAPMFDLSYKDLYRKCMKILKNPLRLDTFTQNSLFRTPVEKPADPTGISMYRITWGPAGYSTGVLKREF
jgi:hypothetical protein